MTEGQTSDATAANLKAFDGVWTRRALLEARFKYNLEAARKEFIAMLDRLDIGRGGQRVLDVGFGSGMLMFEFDPTSVIRGVEISRSALATAESRARARGYRDAVFVQPRSPEALPFDDGSFSVVIASHVVEHVEDDIAFVTELLRVLSPGGYLIVIGPLDATEPGLLDEAALANPEFVNGHYHVRNYNAETFIERIGRAGGDVRATQLSMETWDWKVRGDSWRSKLAANPVGKVVDRGIALAVNLPLSLMPLAALRGVDAFWRARGYHPRQITLAIQRR